MQKQTPVQAIVIDKEAMDKTTSPLLLALFNSDGSKLEIPEAFELEPAEAQADSEATTVEELVDDFNALLAKFRAAGFIAEEEEEEEPTP